MRHMARVFYPNVVLMYSPKRTISLLGLSPISGAEFLKLWEFTLAMSMKWVLECAWGWGLVTSAANPLITELELLVPSLYPIPPERRAQRLNLRLDSKTERRNSWVFIYWLLIPNSQLFSQSCLCNESSIETQKDRVQKHPGWRTRGDLRFGERGALEARAQKLHILSYIHLYNSSSRLFLSFL